MIIWYIIRTCKKVVSGKLYDVIDQNSGKRRDKPSWASILVFSEKKPSVIKWILGKKLLLRINRSPKKWNFPLLPILVDEFGGCSFEISFFFQSCYRNWCQNLISNEQPTNSSTRITLVLYTINLAIHRHK